MNFLSIINDRYQDVPVSSGLKERSSHLGNVNGGAGASILARKNQASAVVEPATVVSRLTSWFWWLFLPIYVY